ncbi:UDP-N-acetylmuramate dehydrogenase [Jatrophihabitans sp. YIM 134969]
MPTTLAELTTLRLGGPIARSVEATTTADLVDAVREADARGEPVLVVGGGSNLVAGDDGWPGTVVRIGTRGIEVADDGEDVLVTVAAGEPWDDLVARSVAEGWSGLAAMSGIPGLTGATPVQNVGAYGAEVADLVEHLDVLDRRTGTTATWSAADVGFGFRTSAFKHTDRYVVLAVTFRLRRSPDSGPVRYLELARRLGVEQDATAPSTAVRDTVLELRRGKGMVLDPADLDTWSVGSFFVNPLVTEVGPELADAPRWQTGPAVKLSAAWLIEHAGFHKGYALDRPPGTVGVSSKHTLALTHRGGGTTAQLLTLAAEIRAGVEARFGVRLGPEAHLAGVTF